MDPRKQECFGHYLYGAGYFARDDNTLGLISGQNVNQHFCLTCPRRSDCETAQQRRVQGTQPDAVERYERAVRMATRQGVSELLAAVALGKRGVNPYFNDAIDNFKRGHGDRGAGPLVHVREQRRRAR